MVMMWFAGGDEMFRRLFLYDLQIFGMIMT
jgi:hypothetical protein